MFRLLMSNFRQATDFPCNCKQLSNVAVVGWFQELFPYIHKCGKYFRNPYLGKWHMPEQLFERVEDMSIKQRRIPSGLSSVPFKFDKRPIGGEVHDMKLFGGLSCVTQDPISGELEPQFGLAVVEVQEPKNEHK